MQYLIDITKQYKTKSGLPVRVLCVDRKHKYYPVVVLVDDKKVQEYTKEGYFDSEAYTDDRDLVEVSPYEDFNIGDYVMVRNSGSSQWRPRVFAGVESGNALAYSPDYHPWSNNTSGIVSWEQCRKPTKEELAEDRITE